MKKKLLSALTAGILFLMPNVNFGQAPDLSSASSFTLFTAAGAFSNDGATVITGDIGTNVGAFTGFPPGIVIGEIHVADLISAQVATDVDLAYGYMSTITCGIVISTTMGGGQSLLPDVYCLGAASTINGDLVLDAQGDPNSLFIFKIDGALATTVGSRILFTNSASLCNVYWQVNGQVDLGENSLFQGTILANGAINLLEGATLNGRGLTRAGAISSHNTVVTNILEPTPSIITANGATTFCEGESVVLSGNVDGEWNTGETTESITVTTAGDYFATNTNICGSVTSNHILVTINPLPVPPIISADGPTTFCEPGSVVLSGNNGGVWSTGETTPSISVTAAGEYFVTVTNECGSAVSNLIVVMVDELPIASIISANGSTILCEPVSVILSGNIGGVWSNGETTFSITVTTPGDYFVTNANACASVISNHIIVEAGLVPGDAGIITGEDTICQTANGIYCILYIDGATSYIWEYSGTGAIIDEILKCQNCVLIHFEYGATSGILTVTGHFDCGDGAVSADFAIVVEQFPEAAGSITGSASVFEGQIAVPYSVGVVPNATGYVWNYTGTGATINGNGNAVTIDFAVDATSGDLSVQGSNSCGDWIPSPIFPITVNPLPPGIITGPAMVAQGQVKVPYDVSEMVNATYYKWTYSGKGATFLGNSNTISINFDDNATSGNLSVTGINSSGIGVGSASLKIAVKSTGIGNSNGKSSNLTLVKNTEFENAVKIFPNPAKDVINIASDLNFSGIILVSFTGQPVYNKTVSDNKLQIDISAFEPGMYFIKIQIQNSVIVKRVTIR